MKGALSLAILTVILIVLLSVFASAQTYELHTSKRLPTIVVPFLEESLIGSFVFTDGINTLPMRYYTENNYTYEFTSLQVLELGIYTLTINPTDTLGNPSLQPLIINLYVDPMSIKMIQPTLGVSSTQIFDVIIETGDMADCRYSTVFEPVSYSDLSPSDSLFKISERRHRISNFTAPTYPSTKPLWVICRDAYGDDTQAQRFDLSVDTTPPIISQARADPELVVEYDEFGEKKTTLLVKTDDPAVCKYSLVSSNYTLMNLDMADDLTDGFFELNNENSRETYIRENQKELKGMANNKAYKYFVSCKNLAQLITRVPAEINFSVNLSAAFAIISTKPTDGDYIGNTNFKLEVLTNKQADCYFSYNDTIDLATSLKIEYEGREEENYKFSSQITGEEGENKIKIYCKPVAAPEEKSIRFVIDTTPPIGKEIRTENVTWMTDELSAEFVFEDNQSGIDYYNYTIKDSKQNVIIENTMTEDSEIIVDTDKDGKRLNLTNLEKYFWYVTATNKAGKTSLQLIGDVEVDISKKPQDIFPPNITIKTALSSKGTNVTIFCIDSKLPSTGCDQNKSFYGVSDTGTCSANKLYNGTFLITKAKYVCYSFSDKATPPNTAQNTIFINVSALIDTDGDGVIDTFDDCLGTPLGQTVDEKGCSCSQLDDDRDGVNNCNDKCPDTLLSETALSDGCSEDQRDTDGDGMPDKWEDDNNLDKFNPRDAGYDPDFDGLYNLDEYKSGSDPRIYDTDKDKIADGGERTSGTGITDVSSTPPDSDNDWVDDDWELRFGLSSSDFMDAYTDTDNDGLNNLNEYNYNLDPGEYDMDGDCFSDGGEITSGTDPKDPQNHPKNTDGDCIDDDWEDEYDCIDSTINDKDLDADNDTLTNGQEYSWGTDPCNDDTDGDGMPDWWEIRYGLNPRLNDADDDPDGDDFTNIDEYRGGANPRDKNDIPLTLDTDGDGIPDWWEKTKGLNYLDPSDAEMDQDNDGLLSIEEYTLFDCLEPFNEDTDGDSYGDDKEIGSGTSPCDPLDKPKSYWWLLILIVVLLALGAGGYFGYKYLYPIIEKKFGKPTLKKWPPFERVVGRPGFRVQPMAGRPGEKKGEKAAEKPKTTEEKLEALAKKEDMFDRLSHVGEKKPKPEKESKETEAEKEQEIKATTAKLEKIGRSEFDKLESVTKRKPGAGTKKLEEIRKPSAFDLLDKVGKAGTREQIFKALPYKKENVFEELRKSINVPRKTLAEITKQTAEKNIGELVKTFELLKDEQGAKASINLFKTLLGHLLKAKKINIKDIEEVLLNLKEQKVFTDRQISDVLFSLKE
jgi:hypothetical protein